MLQACANSNINDALISAQHLQRRGSLDRYAFSIDTIYGRIKKKGDIFAGVHDEKIQQKNNRVLAKLLEGIS